MLYLLFSLSELSFLDLVSVRTIFGLDSVKIIFGLDSVRTIFGLDSINLTGGVFFIANSAIVRCVSTFSKSSWMISLFVRLLRLVPIGFHMM